MTRLPCWTGLLVSTVIAGCARPAPDTSADVAAINAVRDREVMLAALGNADSLATIWTDDIVIMPPGEPAVDGRAAAVQWATTAFGQFTFNVNYTSTNVTVTGHWAYDRFAGVLTLTPKAGGAPMTEQVKGIHVLRKETDGSWKIAMDVWNSDAPPPPPPSTPAK